MTAASELESSIRMAVLVISLLMLAVVLLTMEDE